MIKNILAGFLLIGGAACAHAQASLQGRVTDESGAPLPGVNIRVDNSLTRGTTNGKGEFRITGLQGEEHTLNFSRVGYEPAKYKASGSRDDILVTMREGRNRLSQAVVTGTGTHRRMADSPVPVAVITAEDIAESGAATLEDALTKLSPAISVFTNGMGTTMSLNGIGEDYLLVLENGRRLAGDDRYTRVNVADIKRVEILSGAASALYGSDAIGGVINIITDEARSAADISSYTHYASHGRLTENVNAGASAGKFSSRTSYQRRQAGSWQNNGTDEDGYPTGKPTSTGFYQDNASQRFELRPTSRLAISLHGSWFDNQTRRPRDATYYSGGKEREAYSYDVRHETFTYGAGAKYIAGPRAYLDAEFHSDNFTSSYLYFAKSGSYAPGDEAKRKKTRYYDGSVKGVFRLGGSHKLSVGAEYENSQLESESDNIAFENMYTLSLFAQDEIRLARRLQAVLGVRYAYNGNFRSHAVPNAALMYRAGSFALRAAYAAGFRAPTLSQLYATDLTKTANRYTLGNPGLKPEKSHFCSLNAEYASPALSVSVTGFVNDVRDMINYRVLSPEELAAMGLADEMAAYDEVRRRDNVDKAKAKGLSASLAWRPGAGLAFAAGYACTSTKARQRQDDGAYASSPIDKSVKHAGTLRGSWERAWGKYRLAVSLQGRLQGKRYSQTYGYAPKFQQWDLNTRHAFSLRRLTLEPGLGVENLFNSTDSRPWNNNFSTLTPGRSVYASLSVRFKQ